MKFDNEMLTKIRLYLGYSQSYVSQSINLSEKTFCCIENGELPIPLALIEFYSFTLDVKPSHLQSILFIKNGYQPIVSRAFKKYLCLVIKLKEYEK